MPKGVAKDAGGDSDKDALDVKDLRELVKAFENFKRDYRSDMRELKDSVSFCTDICNDVKGIAENIKQLRQEMHDIVNENKALKAENERLAQKCEELEQYQRLNNVEVKGVPVGDDPVRAMKKIGETVGEAIDEADLDTCHWVKADTISKCFKRAGFMRNAEALEDDEQSNTVADEALNTAGVWSCLVESKFITATDTFQEFVDAGELELAVCVEASTDDVTVTAVCGGCNRRRGRCRPNARTRFSVQRRVGIAHESESTLCEEQFEQEITSVLKLCGG
ncbi:hypothetical protein HPB50_017839 [Hyalomma asiaticum]|uniref:Uncharacterized protein n=1 Tax=Hyalomma asiaticum TaxID=266040 RepID=A0ACB7TQY1_HYAAI|nr:hypothetical protein HPB50_017839 [Hyalomma asiaticum]